MSSGQKNTPGGVPGGKSASPTLEVGLPKHTPPGYSSQELQALDRARDPDWGLTLVQDRVRAVSLWRREFYTERGDFPVIEHPRCYHLLRAIGDRFAEEWLTQGLRGQAAQDALEWLGDCLRQSDG